MTPVEIGRHRSNPPIRCGIRGRAATRATRASTEHPEPGCRLSAQMSAVVFLRDQLEIERALGPVAVLNLETHIREDKPFVLEVQPVGIGHGPMRATVGLSIRPRLMQRPERVRLELIVQHHALD